MTDLSRAELAVVLPLIVLTVVVGVYAAPVFAVLNPAVDALLRQLGAGGG